MSTPKIPSLTSLRGIAAIWVVLFHIDVCIFYRGLGSILPKEGSGLIAQGYLWVDFFFILSGFIITHVYSHNFDRRWRLSPFIQFFLVTIHSSIPSTFGYLITVTAHFYTCSVSLPSSSRWQLDKLFQLGRIHK